MNMTQLQSKPSHFFNPDPNPNPPIPFSQKPIIISCCPSCNTSQNIFKIQPTMPCGHPICTNYSQTCPFNCPDIQKRTPQIIPIQQCKSHLKPKELFCEQDQVFLCWECYQSSHLFHPFKSIIEIEEYAQILRDNVQQVIRKNNIAKVEYIRLLESERDSHKREIDTVIDQRISELRLLKRTFHKEREATLLSEKDFYQNQLGTQTLSKELDRKEELVESWRRNQSEPLASGILEMLSDIIPQDIIDKYEKKAEIVKKQIIKKHKARSTGLSKKLQAIKFSLARLKKISNPSPKIYPKVELNSLISILKDIGGLGASYIRDKDILQLKEPEFFIISSLPTINFNPEFLDLTLEKLTLKLTNLSTESWTLICKILENINQLKDLNIQIQQPHQEGLISLLNAISNLKYLEKFTLTLINPTDLSQFMEAVSSLNHTSSLQIESKENSDIIISFQLIHSSESFQGVEELIMKLNFPDVSFYSSLLKLFSSENCQIINSLKAFKLFLGKNTQKFTHLGPFNPPSFLGQLVWILQPQRQLLEIDFKFESGERFMLDFIAVLAEAIMNNAGSLQKLSLSLGDVELQEEEVSLKLFGKSLENLQNLQELKFGFICKSSGNYQEIHILEQIIKHILPLQKLTKLSLSFNGAKFAFPFMKNLLLNALQCKNLIYLSLEFLNSADFNKTEKRTLLNLMRQFSPCLKGKRVIQTRPVFLVIE